MGTISEHTFTLFSSSSSGIGKSLLGTGLKSCAKLEKLLFCADLTPLAPRCSEARWAGEEAGSRVFLSEGVTGEDFWKNPRIDFWFFMFWVLDVVFFSTAGCGGVAVGDEAEALAIVGEKMQLRWGLDAFYIRFHSKHADIVADAGVEAIELGRQEDRKR